MNAGQRQEQGVWCPRFSVSGASGHPEGWTPNSRAETVLGAPSAFNVSAILQLVCLGLGLLAPAGLAQPKLGDAAIRFDGTNDYVTFGAAPTLGVSNFTVEVWFKREGTGTNANTGAGGFTAIPLVTKGRGESDGGNVDCNWFLGIHGSTHVLAADFEDFASGDNHPVTGVTVIASNVWYHAAATYDGTDWVLYLNGVPEMTNAANATPRYDSIQHAALASALNSSGAASGFFRGVLDEARLWNHARTAVEISNSMNLEITNAAGLVARWGLNEAAGTNTMDSGPGNVTGRLTNGPTWVTTNLAPNVAPNAPALVTPTNGATGLGLAVPLTVSVSDSNAGNLTVVFYGRELPTNAPADFTLVALPDTQFYSSSLNGGTPAMFQAQTDWIVSNRVSRNIVFVTQLGDCVQNGDNGGNNVEWLAATNALYRLENPLTTFLSNGVPYGVAVGNHDQSPGGDASGTTDFYNQYFGTAHFSNYTYYGGHYDTNNDNHYELFTAGGMDFVIVHLEYDNTATTTNAPVYAWANGILQTHATRRAIVVSHHIMNAGFNGSFSGQGQAIYDALKANTNLFLMLCGHVSPPEGQRTNSFGGRTIWTVLSDYQGRANGGDGWLRLYEFSPSNNVIRVKTFSPTRNGGAGEFETDADSQFDIPHGMSTPFVPLRTNVVASGGSTTFLWTNRAPSTAYDWQVTVSDGMNTTTGPVWRFNTANVLVTSNATWRYLDDGSNQGTNWITPAFNDSGWSNGPAQLGYGDGDEATVVGYGGDANNKHITTYFRRTFAVDDLSGIQSLLVRLIRDDGAVVYLNGTEIFRSNMPQLPVNHLTLASGSTPAESAWFTNFAPGSLLVVGTNVLAVEVHQSAVDSSDLSFALELEGRTNLVVVAVTRGPYLQAGTPTNIVVRWRTGFPSDSRVSFGTDVGSLNQSVSDAALTTEHELRITNLSPETVYFYSVGTTTGVLAGGDTNHFFRTAPPRGSVRPTRVWIIGDAGRANANQQAVRDAYYTFTGTNHTDVWLQLGDNAYNDGTDDEYQAAVFDMYPAMLRKTVAWSCLGNHETVQSTAFVDTYPYFDLFTFPTNAEAGGLASGTEHYFSFDFANIHFVNLDSMTADRATNGAMANWLRADLAATTNTWLVAFFHHPPYTKGSHDSDVPSDSAGSMLQMRTNFLPILEAGGVDLVLAGHSHAYERSLLIDGHYDFSSNFTGANVVNGSSGRETNGTGAYGKPRGLPGRFGAVYSVVGSSGQATGGPLNHPAMFISLNNLGSMVLDVNGNRLDAKFIRENGLTNDWFTLLKTNTPPVASNRTFNFSAYAATNLALVAGDLNRDALTFTAVATTTNGLLTNFNSLTGTFTYTPARGTTNPDSFAFLVNDGTTSSAPGTVTLNYQPFADTNANGLADGWEAQFGETNANADPDGDGQSNLQEFWSGTNPNDANSWLRVTNIVGAGGGFSVSWPSVGGARYRVSFSNGGAQGNYNGVFTPIVRAVAQEMDAAPAGTLSTQSFTDNYSLTGGAPTEGRRYYRVQLVR